MRDQLVRRQIHILDAVIVKKFRDRQFASPARFLDRQYSVERDQCEWRIRVVNRVTFFSELFMTWHKLPSVLKQVSLPWRH